MVTFNPLQRTPESRFFGNPVTSGVNLNLSDILGSLKRDLKEKEGWNTTRQLNASERARQVGGQLFGVRLPRKNRLLLDFE